MTDQLPKVAIVYHFFPHYRAPINLELMRSTKYHYLFVGDYQDAADTGIKAWFLDDQFRFIRTKSRFIMGRLLIQGGLLRLALRRDIETIIYHGIAQALTTWISAFVARLTGKRVLFWSHGWVRRDSGLKNMLRSAFYRLAHGMLLYGNRAKAIGTEKKFSPSNLYVVYNSLDHSLQRSLRARYSTENVLRLRSGMFENYHRPLIICTTRLVALRRLDLLLEAMKYLQEQNHPVNLVLVGDGPERSFLEQYSKTHGLSVHFYGECYDEKTLAELIMASNVTVAPGKVGLAAMHSLAYGVPVITHDDPDDQMPESEAIVPGVTGEFFKWEDSKDLARVICEWTSEEFLSPERREQCWTIVDQYYNPDYQKQVIEQAIEGIPATDGLWRQWSE